MATKKFYSTTEMAKIVGREESTIRRKCESGEIRAEKIGGVWIIPASSVKRYRHAKPGPAILHRDAQHEYWRMNRRKSYRKQVEKKSSPKKKSERTT